MRHLLKAAVLICSAVFAMPAHAFTVGLNDTTVAGDTFSDNGISGTVTAGCDYASDPDPCGTDAIIHVNGNGVGVRSPDDRGDQLDNRNNTEFLTFAFDAPVSLFGITFINFTGGDRFTLLINGEIKVLAGTNPNFTLPYEDVSSLTIIAASQGNGGGNFRVVAFDVTPAIPLPAGGVMLASGLLAGAAFGRRRRA